MAKKDKINLDKPNVTNMTVGEIVAYSQEGKTKPSKYPEELKACAVGMRASGYTYRQIAITLKVGEGSVHAWVNSVNERSSGVSDIVEQVKGQLSKKTYNLANHVLSRITDDDIEKASLLQKGTFGAMMIDKARLVDNESTDNIAVLHRVVGNLSTDGTNAQSEIDDLDSDIEDIESQLLDLM